MLFEGVFNCTLIPIRETNMFCNNIINAMWQQNIENETGISVFVGSFLKLIHFHIDLTIN